MKRRFVMILIMTAIIFCSSCKKENETVKLEKPTIMVLAAVSLGAALEEIKEIYERENQVNLTFVLGSSGSLAQQIKHGSLTDIFITADKNWMNRLEREEFIQKETRTDIINNNLVLITNVSSSLTNQSLEEITANDIERIAIGNPESVPVGKYAKEALVNIKKWNELEDKIILAKDARQVLTYVETENTDLGIIYESDAKNSNLVKILAKVESHLHEPIIYSGAVLTNTKHHKEAIDFLNLLKSDQAQIIWESYGFHK